MSGVKGKEQMEGLVLTERDRRRFFLGNSAFLCIAALIVSAVWMLQGRSMERLGFRPVDQVNAALVITLVIAILGLWLGDMILTKKSKGSTSFGTTQDGELPPFLPVHLRELPAFAILCMSAAVFEETIYRGFLVTYFLPGTRGASGIPVAAITVPALLFSLAHYYQGWQATLKIFVLASLMGLLFMVSNSLWIVMGIHFVIDLVGGLYAMHLRRNEP